ncbi:MAG: hypothetical protein RLY86_615 [Pseudomonadota bacterium]|jgi:hypothetical protein
MDNQVLEHLRAIRGDRGALREEVRDLRIGQTDMALALAALRRDQVADAETAAHAQGRLDLTD